MNIKKAVSLSLFASLAIVFSLQAQSYKAKMQDPSVNFYDVVEEAEAYFKTHGTGEGSGFKGFSRWKSEHEGHYYPSGDRSQVDPNFVANSYEKFVANQPASAEKTIFPNGWNELGPATIDSITGHYAVGLGRVESFYVDPSNANRIYLGSRSGGFWKTLDGGTTWTGGSTDFLVASGVNTIGVNPTNVNEILINVRNAGNGNTHGIYRSTDGGDNWAPSNFGPAMLGWGGLGSNDKIYYIAYHPTINNLVFVGTNSGLYRSTDNLATWTNYLSTTQIKDIVFHPTDSSVVYVYDDKNNGPNEDRLLVSSDIGINFVNSDDFANNNDASGYIAVSPDCPDCVWYGSGNGIWKSYDKGANFDFLINPSAACDGFAVSDVDTSNMVYGYVDLEASTNGGQSFTQVTNWSIGTAASWTNGKYIHADLREAQCVNGVFYVATDGLLSSSADNGVTWDILSLGTAIRENYSLGISQSNHYRSISGSQDNGTSIKHKDDWLEFYGADGMEGICHPLNDEWMIGSWQFGGRRRTRDAGQTGIAVTPNAQSGDWIAPMFIDPNQQMHVYSFGQSVWKTEDFADSWTQLAVNPIGGDEIDQAAVAYNNSQVMAISQGRDILKSTNGGASFTNINGSLPNRTITSIAFAPNDDNIMIVTYNRWQNDGDKVFLSTNQGTSWTNITGNLGDMPIRCVIIDHTPDQNIYLGAEIGVYTRPMNGTNWVFHNNSLPNVTVRDLEINFGSNTLRGATWGRGLWEYSLVGRDDYPAILLTETTDEVTLESPVVGNDQIITSVISYDDVLSSVYVKYSINSLLFDQTLTMTNTQDSTWATPAGIPGMVAEDEVYFKVYAVGASNDTSETYKFHYKVRPICSASGSMISSASIVDVEFSGISNPSGKTQPYTDYSASDSAIVELGGTYTISTDVNTDGFQNMYVKIWMDWNSNGNFADLGEEYDLGVAANSSSTPTNNSPLTLTVPATAVLGATKMRVAGRKSVPPLPCLTDMNGEVEDYGIFIVPDGVGIAPEKDLLNIRAWPNPTADLMNLDLGQRFQHIDLVVTNLLGAVQLEQQASGEQQVQIDLSQLSSGVYFARILADGGQGVLKIVKE